MSKGLTFEEDAELRRLTALAAFGQLGMSAAAMYLDLRARDRRADVREPEDLVVPHPKAASDGPVVR